MPRYYFDYRSQHSASTDKVGTVLAGLDVAKKVAAKAAGGWIADRATKSGADLTLSVREGKAAAPVFVVTASIKISELSV
jgi:hypothetical protein